jgi:DNA-binding CsgD family transcriptional regulator
VRGSDEWCGAQLWLSYAVLFAGDPAAALGHFTALRDAAAGRGPCQALAEGLAGRGGVLRALGRGAEAAAEHRRALVVAREVAYPLGEALALGHLAVDASGAGDRDGAGRLIRQAGQVTAGVPGLIVRWCGYLLAEALAEEGDWDGAEATCAAVLARSRDAGDLRNAVALLPIMVALDLQAGRVQDAAVHLREALRLHARMSEQDGLDNCLDWCGLLCAATGRPAQAVTMWAAHAALLESRHMEDWPGDARRRAEPLRRARQALGPGPAQAAGRRGAAMSPETAAAYALMLTDPDLPQSTSPQPGTLSTRERELVILVAQGRTDAQIAAELTISIRTVRSHLDRIRDKTGCRRRADLTRLALTVGII